MKTNKLGDKMPDRRNVKWGSMEAGDSHLSDKYHDVKPSAPKMSEKWDHFAPSEGHMSEKWVEQHPSTAHMSERYAVMKQEERQDPYSMAPSEGDRKLRAAASQSDNNMKNSRHGRYDIRGPEGQSGKGM